MTGALTAPLIAGLSRYVRHALGTAELDAATVRRFEEPLGRLHPVRPTGGDGMRVPVLRDWNRALAGTPVAMRPLLAALGPSLVWTRNPNYRSRPNPRFLAYYGYGVILGPADRRARFALPELERVYHRLIEGDEAVKTSQMPERLALETFVSAITASQQPQPRR